MMSVMISADLTKRLQRRLVGLSRSTSEIGLPCNPFIGISKEVPRLSVIRGSPRCVRVGFRRSRGWENQARLSTQKLLQVVDDPVSAAAQLTGPIGGA